MRRKFLAPPYYSQRAVFVSVWALFYLLVCERTRRKSGDDDSPQEPTDDRLRDTAAAAARSRAMS